jgi:hypothetical protein
MFAKISNSPTEVLSLYIQGAASTSPLNELYGVAVGISDPSGAQLAVEKVMGRREQRRTLGDQGIQCSISVVGPKDHFDPAPFSFWTKAVMRPGCLYRSDSEGESIQLEFDMDHFA